MQVIRWHIKGCLKKEQNLMKETLEDCPKPAKIKGAYTARDVIKQQYRSLLDEEILFKPQTKENLSQYQCAVTTVLNQMDGSERKKVEELAQSWNEQGAPRKVQYK
jgi:hypothetical protein